MSHLRKLYNKTICDKLCIIYEDLTEIELEIMNESFDIILSKIVEIKELNDLIYNKDIEIKNLKSFNDDKDY